MKFEDVLNNGRLWAVIYDGDSENILTETFAKWIDIDFLTSFFSKNKKDLGDFFKITNITSRCIF